MKNTNASRFICLLMFLACGFFAYGEDSLLVNGSFEASNPGGPMLNFPAGSTDITGWTVINANVDYMDMASENPNLRWQAAEGTRSIDLAGSPGMGGMAQTFATTAGFKYTVTFAMAGNYSGAPTIKTMQVQAAGQSDTFTFDTTGKSATDMGWECHTWTFTAASSATTLEFLNATAGGEYFGPVLDDVTVVRDYDWTYYNGHAYAFTDYGSWQDCQDEAAEAGGHLAVIENAAENEWISDFIKDVYAGQMSSDPYQNIAWIGYIYRDSAWQWMTGDAVVYTNYYDHPTFPDWYTTTGPDAYMHGDSHPYPRFWCHNEIHEGPLQPVGVIEIDTNEWIWGVKSNDPVSSPPATLFRFQADGTFVEIGAIMLDSSNVDVDGLAIDATQGLYGFSVTTAGTSSQLLSIDKVTAQATAIGSALIERDIRGAVFDHSGRLIVIDAAQDQLLQIDPATGAIVRVLFQLPAATNLVDITQQRDGTFMIIDANTFYRLFLWQGAGVLTGYYTETTPGQESYGINMAGLAVSGTGTDPDLLYMYDVGEQDDIYSYAYTYDPAARLSRSTVVANLISGYDAGRGDLAAMPLNLLDTYPMTRWTTAEGGNNHWYQTVQVLGGLTWHEARDVAADRGGYLATMHSTAENNFCYNLLNDPVLWYIDGWGSGIGPWLGGYELGEGTWFWVTGEPWTFWAWASGEPNNLGGNEAFLHFFSNTGSLMNNTWNDVGANVMIHGFLVEWSRPQPPYNLVDFADFAGDWQTDHTQLNWSPVWDFDDSGDIGIDDLANFTAGWIQ
jgi:choice-of-anchor C domain-containing protein